MTLTHRAAHTIAPERPATWYSQPVTELQHGFVGFRSACHAVTWQASFGIVGPLEAVDRSKACQACLIVTGSTDSELRLMDGGR